MGMFDALMIEIDDHPVELQTKNFDNILGNYYPGDSISGAPSGIHVYYDTVNLDNDGKHIYNAEKTVKSYTVFVVLAHSVFTAYTIEEGKLDDSEIEFHLKNLDKYWNDSSHILFSWLEFLKNKQKRISVLNRQVYDVQSVIDYSRKLEAGEDLAKQPLFFKTIETKLIEGEDVLDVIESALNNKNPEFLLGINSTDKPLQQHRL